jgi:hypothetical protein
VKILGIDPGKVTGLGMIEVDGKTIKLVSMRESKDVTCSDYLDLLQEADQIVLEGFLTRPKNARAGNFDWDDMVAPRVIGAVTALAHAFQKSLVIQQPAVKPVGYAWSNQRYVKGKKGQHVPDALAHAVYYAVRTLKANPLGNS